MVTRRKPGARGRGRIPHWHGIPKRVDDFARWIGEQESMKLRQPTFVKRGDLTADWQQNGNVRLVRETTMQWVELSPSEWVFLVRAAELVGWPTVSPVSMAEILSRYTGMIDTTVPPESGNPPG